MNKLEIEKAIDEIYSLRSKKNALARQIKDKVDKVISHMQSVNKRALKTSDYSVELMTRIRRDMDFDELDKLVEKGIIPEHVIAKSEYERLMISSHKDIKLVNGKWVEK